MEFEINFFRVDETGCITHMAGVIPTADNPEPECTPETIRWCPVDQSELSDECGVVCRLRRAVETFNAYNWNLPPTPTAERQIDFDNVRQIMNPYGGGTHTCQCAGMARCFIKGMLEFPRFETWYGTIELGGADYLTASENAGRGKRNAPIKPKRFTPVDATFDDDERREFRFTRKVAAFNAYVDWLGRHAGCGRAAQGVVLAVDRLYRALRECGIKETAAIVREVGEIENALAEMCRALGDAENAHATGKPTRNLVGGMERLQETVAGLQETANETQTGVNLTLKKIKGIEGAANDMRETADAMKRTQADAAETFADAAGQISEQLDAGMERFGKVADSMHAAVGSIKADVQAGRKAAEQAAVRADEAKVHAANAERNTGVIAKTLAKKWNGFIADLRAGGYDVDSTRINATAQTCVLKLWDQFKDGKLDGKISEINAVDIGEIKHNSFDYFMDYCGTMIVYSPPTGGTQFALNDIITQGTEQLRKLVHTRNQKRSAAKKAKTTAKKKSKPRQ